MEGFTPLCGREAAAVICIGIIDLLFARRFMFFLIGEADGSSSASTISSATNSHGRIGSFPLS